MSPTIRHTLLGCFLLLCLLALIWPGYAWFGNGLTPVILGIPWSFAWSIGWLLASFAGMLVFHFTGENP
jgi:hypothetical protein